VDDVAQRDDEQSGAYDTDGEQDEEDAGEVQGSGSCRVFGRSNGLADLQIRGRVRF
jgi:hypothetical protein